MRIGIVGPMGSGKTTAATILTEHHGFRRGSLATPVKDIVDGMSNYDTIEERATFLYRWAMTLLPDSLYGAPNPYSEVGSTSRDILVALWLKAYDECASKRELYQRVGTDCGRSINSEIWINYFARRLTEGNVVIDDVRFINEGEALSTLGFHLLRLEPPESTRAGRLLERDGGIDEERMKHASETEIRQIGCHEVFENSGDLNDLHRFIGSLVGRLRTRATA